MLVFLFFFNFINEVPKELEDKHVEWCVDEREQ